MSFLSDTRDLWRAWTRRPPAGLQDSLRTQTNAFCAAATLPEQTRCLIDLFAGIWGEPSDSAFHGSLITWLETVENDLELREQFQGGWHSMLGRLDSLSLLAEAGLPAQHALMREVTGRLFARWLPAPRAEDDTTRLFAAIFRTRRAAERFTRLNAALFARLAAVTWGSEGLAAYPRPHQDLHEALRLLAARVAARGTSHAVRQRINTDLVEQSPSYALVFKTETMITCEHDTSQEDCRDRWLEAVYACRGELAIVRLNMETAGVNAPLVFDLSAMETALDRMEMLAATLAGPREERQEAVRHLLNELVEGMQEDVRITSLIQRNLNMLARKTVERTGHGGEHYIAHTRKEYWQMWRAALGGGLLTVLTAALKLHLVGQHYPPLVEAVLVGTNYAVSFLLLQTFGLALATKQPAMTGATLADIIRRNRDVTRRDRILEFGASISRTQLAAALGNVLAVSLGAIAFNLAWTRVFGHAYVPVEQASKVYLSLRPFASATAIDAALTGVLLWLAGLIGGWCENFAVFHRIPASIAEHPMGQALGSDRMKRLSVWVDDHIGSWSTSISLGYLLGFTPEVFAFMGLPFDVRHVTLNTGMFAFAASRFGLSAFRQEWLYAAIGGIAVMFVLNLGVSFALASFVALRAYDVEHKERASILRYVLRQLVQAPRRFLLPVRETTATPAAPPTAESQSSIPAA